MRLDQSWYSADDTVRIAAAVMDAIGTPHALKCAEAVRSGNFASYLGLSPNPYHYTDSLSFYKDYQAANLLKKAEFLDAGYDREKAAVEKFIKVEEDCLQANIRLEELIDTGVIDHNDNSRTLRIRRVLYRAQDLIRFMLRDNPTLSGFRFGPGATSLVSGALTLPQKYSHQIDVTPELYPYWRDVAGPKWASIITNVNIVTGNTACFVPKNMKTHRAICTEPHLNIYAQLGVGGAMRRLFKPWIDLTIGQERNQALAQHAQLKGLSTIDFESASDSISSMLVWFLLPEKWAMLLDRVRSHRCVFKGEEILLHKHSSMGNGYTFELESIIFYALAYASVECQGLNPSTLPSVSAYGDDVILPSEAAGLFTEVCEFVGFTVNREKSFLSGSFFESCGSDFFNGTNVRPKQWKRLNPLHGFKVHNDILEMAERLQSNKLQELADLVRASAPVDLQKCLIPNGYGNVGFIVSFDDATPTVRRAEDGWCGFKTKALKYVPRKKNYQSSINGLLAALDMASDFSTAPMRKAGTFEVGSLTTFGQWSAQAYVS